MSGVSERSVNRTSGSLMILNALEMEYISILIFSDEK